MIGSFLYQLDRLEYLQWGAHVIGMPAMPEAKLAREAELPYALVGMVTDYDCWRQGKAPVEVEAVIAQLAAIAEKSRALLSHFAAGLPAHSEPSPIDHVLDAAIVTEAARCDRQLMAKLDAVAGRFC